MPAEKRCSKCGEVKPLSEFSRRRASHDGYNYACKACRKTADAKRHKGNGQEPIRHYMQNDGAECLYDPTHMFSGTFDRLSFIGSDGH